VVDQRSKRVRSSTVAAADQVGFAMIRKDRPGNRPQVGAVGNVQLPIVPLIGAAEEDRLRIVGVRLVGKGAVVDPPVLPAQDADQVEARVEIAEEAFRKYDLEKVVPREWGRVPRFGPDGRDSRNRYCYPFPATRSRSKNCQCWVSVTNSSVAD
jgi:hypothetical protein